MATAILAVQGAFAEHASMLQRLGEPYVLLRQASDLHQPFERLVLPGGESTTQAKLLFEQGMLKPLRAAIAAGMPTLATCAGLILLARDLEGDDPPHEKRFATLPVRVRRNAYGRQLASFRTGVEFAGVGAVPATFIRAPQIVAADPEVCTLAQHDGVPVAVQSGTQIACAFHPELDESIAVHELFLSL